MYEDDMSIDINRLRRDLEDESLGALFGGGFGGALIEAYDIRRASDAVVIRIAKQEGIDLRKYKTR